MATRFYGHEASTAPITPSADAAWTNTGSIRRRAMHSHGGRLGDTALTTVAITAPTAGQVQIYGQWISRPMAAGNVFDTSVTYKAYFQVLESAANDNLFARCGIRIVSSDGSTVRATIKSVADYSTATEFSTSLRNKAFLNGDAGAGSYTTVDGDRLVFEFGAADASGTSIQGSCRFGSTDAAISDLPENETDTTTTKRPWFECSLNITFKAPTEEVRYVNTASTSGGDGTTNATSGANRAFATFAELVASSWWATDFPTANKRATVNFSGSAADANAADVNSGVRQSAPDCYYNLLFDSPSAMQYSTAYYRMEPNAKGVHAFSNSGILYLRMSGYQMKSFPPDSGGYLGFNPLSAATLEPGDIRVDRMCFTEVLNNTSTGGPSGIASLTAAPNVKVTITNSVGFGFTGSGSTHNAYRKQSGCTMDMAVENCLAYGSDRGFQSDTTDLLVKNCNAQSCTDGYNGTFSASSTNNASDIASDAPGTSSQTGTTTFVSAGSDFHLSASDTVCIGNGVDLSADSRLAFSTDGDGETRGATWSIGPDQILGATGNASITVPMLTDSMAGTVAIVGTASDTLPQLTTTTAGAVAITGTSSKALPMLTISASGAIAITGSSALTVPMLTISASGTVATATINGDGAVTVPMLTISASGVVAVQATGAVTVPMLTGSASGVVAIQATAALSVPMYTGAAAGTETVTGTATPSMPMLTVSATGVVTITATGAVTVPMLTLSASGTIPHTATGAVTVPMLTLSAAATEPVTGTASDALPMLAVSASGAIAIVATGAVAVPMLTVSGSGVVAITGSSAVTMPMLTISASGVTPIAGTATVSLPMLTLVADASIPIVGDGLTSVPMLALGADGTIPLNGDVSVSLPMFSLSGAAAEEVQGAGDVTVPMLTLDASATIPLNADGAVTLAMLTMTGFGITQSGGYLIADLPMVSLDASGSIPVNADADLTLPMLTGESAAVVEVAGTSTMAVPMFGVAGQGVVAEVGDVLADLPMLTIAATGSIPVVGDGAVTMPMLILLASEALPTGLIDVIVPIRGGTRYSVPVSGGVRYRVPVNEQAGWQVPAYPRRRT